MNAVMWVAAGAAAAWIAIGLLKLKVGLSLPLSVLIGAGGGFMGGSVLGPLLGARVLDPGDFHPLPLFLAAATGLACVILSGMIRKRFGT